MSKTGRGVMPRQTALQRRGFRPPAASPVRPASPSKFAGSKHAPKLVAPTSRRVTLLDSKPAEPASVEPNRAEPKAAQLEGVALKSAEADPVAAKHDRVKRAAVTRDAAARAGEDRSAGRDDVEDRGPGGDSGR